MLFQLNVLHQLTQEPDGRKNFLLGVDKVNILAILAEWNLINRHIYSTDEYPSWLKKDIQEEYGVPLDTLFVAELTITDEGRTFLSSVCAWDVRLADAITTPSEEGF